MGSVKYLQSSEDKVALERKMFFFQSLIIYGISRSFVITFAYILNILVESKKVNLTT